MGTVVVQPSDLVHRLSEQELIQQLIAGNQSAYRFLFDENKKRVFNASLGMLQNRADAEDVMQEVFVEAFLSIKKFRGDSKLSTWLYRIAITKSLDFIKHKGRKKRSAITVELFHPESGEPLHDVSTQLHPGIQLEQKEHAVMLNKAIDELPPNQKAAYVLNKIEGLSYKEVSDVLQVSFSSVESTIHRAKENLKQSLSKILNT